MQQGEEAAVAIAGATADIFDRTLDPELIARFLGEPGHHLLIACEGQLPVGFVTGVEMTHPDKGTEMFLYELGVAPAFRRRGIGQTLVSALRDLAIERGCYSMWVLTDAGNYAAQATYERAGAQARSNPVMLEWDLRAGPKG